MVPKDIVVSFRVKDQYGTWNLAGTEILQKKSDIKKKEKTFLPSLPVRNPDMNNIS